MNILCGFEETAGLVWTATPRTLPGGSAVFCGSSHGAYPAYADAAKNLGGELRELGHRP